MEKEVSIEIYGADINLLGKDFYCDEAGEVVGVTVGYVTRDGHKIVDDRSTFGMNGCKHHYQSRGTCDKLKITCPVAGVTSMPFFRNRVSQLRLLPAHED